MRQDFATRLMLAWVAVAIVPATADAARVRGRVERPPADEPGEVHGYTLTRVAAPSPAQAEDRAAVALFLRVKTSLPLPEPETHQTIRISGLQLSPSVATCAVDGKVIFVNDNQVTVTLRVAGERFAALEPGDSEAYECSAGESNRRIQVAEWSHMRGLIYVGEVGVAAAPDEDGAFSLSAPDGEYELLAVGESGVVVQQPVEISGRDVDVGTLTPEAQEGEASDEAGEGTP